MQKRPLVNAGMAGKSRFSGISVGCGLSDVYPFPSAASICAVTSSIAAMPSTDFSIPLPR
jgi:hypothetical protein